MSGRPETNGPPKAPKGLGGPGSALWTSVVGDFDLDEHELALLLEASRTRDLLEQLEAAVKRDGPLVTGKDGQRVHPAAVEARQQRLTLARLLAALRVPWGDERDQTERVKRSQRRSGVRGFYAVGGS